MGFLCRLRVLWKTVQTPRAQLFCIHSKRVGVGDETSGFCGDGDGAEVASLANRLARTYEDSAQAFGWQQLPYQGHPLEQTFAV